MKKLKIVNTFDQELIRIKKEEERLIVEKLKEQWQKSPMNFLSFKEWVLM
jgi:vacuolar-type H+-ATPase subunit B/Vma2